MKSVRSTIGLKAKNESHPIAISWLNLESSQRCHMFENAPIAPKRGLLVKIYDRYNARAHVLRLREDAIDYWDNIFDKD